MQTLTLIIVSATSGFLGGVLGSRLVSAPEDAPRNITVDSIALRGTNDECHLRSSGLYCWTTSGGRAEITPFSLSVSVQGEKAEIRPVSLSVSVQEGEHRAVLGAAAESTVLNGFAGASFLLLDGKLYHPSSVDPVKLLGS